MGTALSAQDPRVRAARAVHVREPDAAAVLAFRPGDHGGDLVVLGPQTRASYLTPNDLPRCVTIRLRPGRARPVLGVPMSELVDRVVPLHDLWGPYATALTGKLSRARTGTAELLTGALAARLDRQSAADLARAALVESAAGLLAGTEGPGRVPEVAGELGVSERHLRNLFTDGVGVPPKRFARIHRVRTVLAQARHEPWAELAADTGYYDQSHMSADFRAVMGVPPGAYRAGRLPAARECEYSVLQHVGHQAGLA